MRALSCATGYNIRWLLRAIVRLAAKRSSLALSGLAFYVRISITRAQSSVLVVLVALRQAMTQRVGFTAPWVHAAGQVGCVSR